MGQKDKTERATGLLPGRREQERGYRKVGSKTDSPENPDREETSEIPGPPFGGRPPTS